MKFWKPDDAANTFWLFQRLSSQKWSECCIIRDRYGITDGDVERLITSLRTDALLVAGNYEVRGISADPDDDKFLACALEAGADCIVTGDPDLLDLGQYQRVNILAASVFKPTRHWLIVQAAAESCFNRPRTPCRYGVTRIKQIDADFIFRTYARDMGIEGCLSCSRM